MICPACKVEVDDDAKRCPHCTTRYGTPWWTWAAAAVIGALIALVLSARSQDKADDYGRDLLECIRQGGTAVTCYDSP